MEMNAEDYIKQRLDDQINWYDKTSTESQRRYKCLRSIEIVVAATIPFLAGFSTDALPALKIAAGLAGIIVVVVSGFLALNQYQENWIDYRTTCESLRHHKYRFLTGAEPYSDQGDAFGHLVNNTEDLISKENTNWANYIKADSKEHSNG